MRTGFDPMQYMQDIQMTHCRSAMEKQKKKEKENCHREITLIFVDTKASNIVYDERGDIQYVVA